jgi:hypothetical protein
MTHNEKRIKALENALGWALMTGEWDECNETNAQMYLMSTQLLVESKRGDHDGPQIITPGMLQ